VPEFFCLWTCLSLESRNLCWNNFAEREGSQTALFLRYDRPMPKAKRSYSSSTGISGSYLARYVSLSISDDLLTSCKNNSLRIALCFRLSVSYITGGTLKDFRENWYW
jgi:hypothetical protein